MERRFIPSVALPWQIGGGCRRGAPHAASWRQPVLLAILPAMLMACRPEAETTQSLARPVRTVVAEKSVGTTPVTFTGRIEADDEVSLAFRISGRVLERDVSLGDRVEAASSSLVSSRRTS